MQHKAIQFHPDQEYPLHQTTKDTFSFFLNWRFDLPFIKFNHCNDHLPHTVSVLSVTNINKWSSNRTAIYTRNSFIGNGDL